MSSSELADALGVIQPFVYGGLVLGAFVQWLRRPSRAGAWLVATFGVLAVVLVTAEILPGDSTDPAARWATKGLIATLALFPYCLYRFMTSFIRPIQWVWVTANVLTVAVVLGALTFADFSQEEPRSSSLQVYLPALLIQWVFLSGIVAVRLWRAGRSQPIVARRRMRTMSVAAAGLALGVVMAFELSDSGAAEVLVQLLGLGCAALMLIGFAPPNVLRVAWRRQEEAALKDAGLSLMEATTTSEVALTLLPHARNLVGAAAAVLEDMDGQIIASDGLDDEKARAAIESRRDDAASDGAPQRELMTVPMRSGRLTVVASPFTPFFGHDEISRLEGLASLADLALARNQLLDNQRRLAAIVESSDDAIMAKSLDGTITSWNRGAERIYGYRGEEAVGKPIAMLVPADLQDEAPAILRKVGNDESIEHYETRRRTKDGRTIDVSLTISPIKDADGKVTGASVIARDVSERKAIEREREAAREAADRANRAKSDFLSQMSHELRTPLNAVLGFAQLLEMDRLTPQQRDGTAEIIKAGRHLLELIDEVLDISRIEAGRLRLSLEPVDAVHAVEECISLLSPLAAEESISLFLDLPGPPNRSAYVTADRQRLKQVLLNLISNGIKYNQEDGSVRISLRSTGPGRRLEIDVTDTGHGISAKRMEQLFVPFERLGAEGSGVEGIGLGLALSKPLVEAMGGTISVASEPGKGTTFSVILASAEDVSLLAAHEDGSQDGTMSAATPSSRTILYIEDNLSNLRLVEQLVARRPGIALISAMQGGIGVTLARDHRPDLILLDLNLPDLAGEDVLARLNSDPRTAELPVVVISADATSGQLNRLLDAGADAYLTKPLDVSRFFQVIDDYCAEPGASS